MTTRRSQYALVTLFALAAGAAGVGLTSGLLARAALRAADAAPVGEYEWFDPIIDVERLIAQRHVKDPPLEEMQQRAIRALVESLGDPYSQFIPTQRIDDFDKQVRGEYVGIGATVRMLDGFVTIVTPHEGSPALAAGVKPGDRVVAVEGRDVVGMDVDEVVELLVGEPGTPVRATFERDSRRFERSITRRRIVTKSVLGFARLGQEWDYFLDPARKIGYARISHFGSETGREFADALTSLREADVAGLILDLRFNGGGLVASAVEVADALLDNGLIFSSKGRAHPETTVRATPDETILADVPIVVLINNQSASASEIVAGALKGNGRAIVVGERSFGKGSMQATHTLPSGAGRLHLTEQLYYLPTGRPIQRTDDSAVWGVDPSDGFHISMTDAQYRDMLLLRSELDAIHGAEASPEDAHLPEGPRDAEWVREHLKDAQLALAVEAARSRLAQGDWPAPAAHDDSADAQQAAAHEEMERLRLIRERLQRELDRIERRMAALASAGADTAEPELLLPEDAPLLGGTVEIRDAQGMLIARFRVAGEGLERWFIDAPLEPIDAP